MKNRSLKIQFIPVYLSLIIFPPVWGATVMNLDTSTAAADWYFNWFNYPGEAASNYPKVAIAYTRSYSCWEFNDYDYYNGHVYGCPYSFAEAQAGAISQLSALMDQRAATSPGVRQAIVATFKGDVYGQLRYGGLQAAKNVPNQRCDSIEPDPPTAGNPIVVAGGAKFQIETDYIAPKNGILSFHRYYSSQGESSLDMGQGWAHDYSAHLRSNQTMSDAAFANGRISVISAIRDNGAARLFNLSSSTWVPQDAAHSKLIFSNNQFILFDLDDSVIEIYRTDGSLVSRTSIDGRSVSLTTVPIGTQVQDRYGRNLVLTKNVAGSITSVTQPDGQSSAYAYTSGSVAVANLATVTYSDQGNRTYLYEDPLLTSALTGLQDELGVRFASWTYDFTGGATSSEHAGGVDRYQVSGTTTTNPTVLLPNGQTVTYALSNYLGQARVLSKNQPAGAGCTASISAQTLDTSGNIASKDDFSGNRVCYASDTTRNLRTIALEGLAGGGGGKACPGDLAGYSPSTSDSAHPERKTTTVWHPDWALRAREASPLRMTTWVYNGQPDPIGGGVAACAPAAPALPDGKPIVVLCARYEQATSDTTGALGVAATVVGATRNWSYTYDQFGQVLTETTPKQSPTDPLSHTTTYVYYADTSLSGGAGHTKGDLYTVTNPLSQTTTFTSYDAAGRLLSSTDANGVIATQTYWPRGWLQSQTVTPATGQGSTLSTTYAYWPTGLLKTVTMPDGGTLSYAYDDAHRLTDVTDVAGNKMHYVLDNVGNRTSKQVSDVSGNLASTVTRVFDALNRVQSQTGALH